MAKGDAGKPVSVPKNSPATVVVPALKVYVREAFFIAGEGECWLPGSGIADLSFEIDGKAVAGKKSKTNKPHKITAGLLLKVTLHEDMATASRVAARAKSVEGSEATLSLAGVADGKHVLKVVPEGNRTSSAVAGPATSSSQARLDRPLHVGFSLKGGLLTAASELDPADSDADVTHGHVTAFKGDELCIDLKPDWMKTTAGVHKRTKKVDLIVVHHTGGKVIGPALNEALAAKGPHYEIDPEGHIVKFVSDDHVAAHAGESWWDGAPSCNSYGIGIEIVHWQPDPPGSAPIPPVQDAQYDSLIGLLKALVKNHGMKPHRIVGHSDVRTSKADARLLGSDRQTCPGGMFEWTRLEDEGLGMIPKAGVQIEDDWGGYFKKYSDPLRFGDSDTKRVFGGKKRSDVAGTVLALQRDLLGIGYSVKTSGQFDEYTRQAVDRFKRHFFTGTRSDRAPKSLAVSDRIDADTASMIVAVRMGLPKAASQPAAPTPGTKPAGTPSGGTPPPATGSQQGMLSPEDDPTGEDADAYALDGNQGEATETTEG